MNIIANSQICLIAFSFGLLISIPANAADVKTQKPGGKGLVTENAAPLTVTLDVGRVRQEIRGFGASDCWSIQYVGTWPAAKVNAIADLLFSTELKPSGEPKGIGLSQWRMNLGAGSSRHDFIRDSWRRGDFFYNEDLTGYDWQRCAGQRRFLQLAKDRGVRQFIAFCNSPPTMMTKNGHAFCDPDVGSTNLDPNKVEDFAAYLGDVVAHFKTAEGIEFTSISPINEPEWDWNGSLRRGRMQASQEGCRYDNADIKSVVTALSAALKRRGLETEIEICESGQIDYLYTNGKEKGEHIEQLFDPASEAFIGNLLDGVICSHSYFTDTPQSGLVEKRQALRKKLDEYNLHYAQTEYCILGDRGPRRDYGIAPALQVARTIHFDMVIAEAVNWQWWLAVSPYDYKDGLIYCDKNNDDGNFYASKILWAMGNYSRFIRSGMHRVELSRSDNKAHAETVEDLMVSGYYDRENRTAAAVFVNYSDADRPVQIAFSNLPKGASVEMLMPFVTAGDDMEQDSLSPYTAMRPDAVFMIPARSVVTVAGLPSQDR